MAHLFCHSCGTKLSYAHAQPNFCGKCGSRVWADLDTGVASVAGGSLDDPEVFQPTMVHCENDAPSWARVPSSLASLPDR